MANRLSQLMSQLDRLYEYDREPVVPAQFKPGRQFAGLLAGEHVAGTEFVIGAFFVLHGVSFANLLWGLLFGNLLAIMWRFMGWCSCPWAPSLSPNIGFFRRLELSNTDARDAVPP